MSFYKKSRASLVECQREDVPIGHAAWAATFAGMIKATESTSMFFDASTMTTRKYREALVNQISYQINQLERVDTCLQRLILESSSNLSLRFSLS